MLSSSSPIPDLSEAQIANWHYSRDSPFQSIFSAPLYEKPYEKEWFALEPFKSTSDTYNEVQFRFSGPAKPHIPRSVIQLLERSKKRPLKAKETTKVLAKIADISINFYKIKEGKYIAIGLDGRVVESADSPIDLLSKIQGRVFKTQVFVWHVGKDVFSGWTT